MKDIFDLIESQQNRMHTMHNDFMSLMKEYMASSDISSARSVNIEEEVEEISDDPGELSGDLIDGWGRVEEESHDGNSFDGLGTVELPGYCGEDIDIDDPSWATGRFLGLPNSLTLNYTERGAIDSLLPLEGLFKEDGGL